MRHRATCAARLAASRPALRSGSPVPEQSLLRGAEKNHLTLSSVVRNTFHCARGKSKKVRSSAPPSWRLRTAPGHRLAHLRSNAVTAARAASPLAA
jgi:hypothetical protein